MRYTILFALALLLLSGGAAAQTSNQDCLECHRDPALTKEIGGGKTVSVHVDPQKFGAWVHAPLGCTDCHTTIGEYPHENVAPADCSSCHSEVVTEYGGSVHGLARANGDRIAASCADCHGTHDILPKSDPQARTNRFNVPGMCSSCHADTSVTKSHPIPPPEVIAQYFESVHGRGTLEKGLNVSAICSDCHGAHTVLPKENPSSTISRANVPRTCRQCHEGIFMLYEQSTHGQQWAKGNVEAPVCVTCHQSHGIRRTETASFRHGIVTECANCHAAEAPTYRDSFHGQAAELGFDPAAKCSDCHTPHLNLPKTDPRSSIAPANLVKTCARCHPKANANFATFQPHADPHDKVKSPQVYYVYNYFLKWLLLGVFAFFGVHTLLWLQRSVVAYFRGELPRHLAGEQWIRRFEKKHILTHVAIVVSFLFLAATGLPLMYSHQPWGAALARLFGGVGGSTFLHRVFAIVTFGYAFCHLFFLLHRLLVKRDLKIFWGPHSMTPRWRDFIDLKNMARWFLYLGPRPRFDRFTYWEKFDYFAVFWGVPIIGLSGLMLWIPEFFTRFLPGWSLNVAMLVHGDEALLAIGFIFTFHFFHTHLRPEGFPLDPVMFTGKVPLERFRDERPDEYDRLIREGRLEQAMVGPPTVGQVRFARWFGFTTLAIGVLLIVAIYVTVFRQLFD